MNAYPVGTAVRLTIPLIDFQGDPVEPTGLAYQVFDLEEEEVGVRVNLLFEGVTDAEITVASELNALPDGAVSGGRIVRVFVASDTGEHVVEEVYALRAYRRLVPPQNSFQTDAAAQVIAGDLPQIVFLGSASPTDRQAALIEAHTRITRLPLRVIPYECHRERVLDREAWAQMRDSDYRELPAEMRKALVRAQLLEAESILKGDPIGDKRRSGILSETIGESSMMFQSGRAPLMPLGSSDALAALSAYLVARSRIERA